ncbi:hypothetical protein [Acinetobacter sp. ANC 3813]|uniref:hypothetical protein n=1 Tax=Acinetobacter sp. ANC 3813 TaxID=1977873 RepID=UPI000A34BFF9|nr:hypothetical protein [Acinetobacter sp. ANC 3813]OTG91327.1 hypothetical protein B9T34_03200 [Acinetobacter sp. ANC 3813]
MDNVSDSYFLVKVLLSISVFGCSIVPLFADFNKTHATNPTWVGHARFHVVWQCLSYGAIGFFSYYLLWFYQASSVDHFYVVALLNAFIYAGFFGAYLSMPVYGGEAFDENGYPPIKTKYLTFELNVWAFSVFSLILLSAFLQLHFGIFK